MIIGVLSCLLLARWQWNRAEEKKTLQAGYVLAAQGSPLPFAEVQLQRGGQPPVHPIRVSVAGRADPARQLLMDSQTHAGRVGYRVWVPVLLTGSQRWVLVDRGWVPATASRQTLPEVNLNVTAVQWVGLWRRLPESGWRLGVNDCDRSRWPHVVQYPTRAELECLLQVPVIDGLVLLAPDQPQGYIREWLPTDMPPEKHLAYAVQWLGLAAATIVIFFVVNLRNSHEA